MLSHKTSSKVEHCVIINTISLFLISSLISFIGWCSRTLLHDIYVTKNLTEADILTGCAMDEKYFYQQHSFFKRFSSLILNNPVPNKSLFGNDRKQFSSIHMCFIITCNVHCWISQIVDHINGELWKLLVFSPYSSCAINKQSRLIRSNRIWNQQ